MEEYQFSGERPGFGAQESVRALFATCFKVLCKDRDPQRTSARIVNGMVNMETW